MTHPLNGVLFTEKRNKLPSHKKIRRNRERILPFERSQYENTIYCALLTISPAGKGKTIDTVRRSPTVRGFGGRRWGMKHRACLGWWTYSVWYNNAGYRTLWVCPNPMKFTPPKENFSMHMLKKSFRRSEIDNNDKRIWLCYNHMKRPHWREWGKDVKRHNMEMNEVCQTKSRMNYT